VRFAGLVPLSLVDYPGHAAVTVFTAGCPLRCPYCQNPRLVVGPFPPPLPEEEVLAFLRRRRPHLHHLVVSGGEPTLHAGLADFLGRARRLGYAVKLDTSGSRPDVLAGLLAAHLCDYVAMDVKTRWARYGELGAAADPEAHRRAAGLVRALAPDYEFRTTVVPGLVGLEDLRAIASELAGSRRFVLQQFVPGPHLLDPTWGAVAPSPDATLRAWAEELRGYFVEPVGVRGVGPTAPTGPAAPRTRGSV
jgi:pyruvate formate lyase activating enzyme